MDPDFQPDYRYLVAAADNRRPARLPLYEHTIGPKVMERIAGARFAALEGEGAAERREFFRHYCDFWRRMTYDTVSYEVCVTTILPDHGAIVGGRPGPIQNRADFEAYPWDDLPRLFWERAAPRYAALAEAMPAGMKAVGGVGNGVFEISEDLVGYEYLCYMQADDPELFADLYVRIGDLLTELWKTFLARHAEAYCIGRFGDDLGFKTATLLSPETIIRHIMPQYRRIISQIRNSGRPMLLHSCGCIFDVMKSLIAAGISAKHSNEDQIAPFDEWIERYGDRIGLFGGIDVDVLCTKPPDEVYETTLELGERFRRDAVGYALGSGNSIPDYVPDEGYLAMVRAAQQLRRRETAGL